MTRPASESMTPALTLIEPGPLATARLAAAAVDGRAAGRARAARTSLACCRARAAGSRSSSSSSTVVRRVDRAAGSGSVGVTMRHPLDTYDPPPLPPLPPLPLLTAAGPW